MTDRRTNIVYFCIFGISYDGSIERPYSGHLGKMLCRRDKTIRLAEIQFGASLKLIL